MIRSDKQLIQDIKEVTYRLHYEMLAHHPDYKDDIWWKVFKRHHDQIYQMLVQNGKT